MKKSWINQEVKHFINSYILWNNNFNYVYWLGNDWNVENVYNMLGVRNKTRIH